MKKYLSLIATLVVFSLLMAEGVFASSYTSTEISSHNTQDDCWTSYDNKVYDLTEYVADHDVYLNIREWCGADMTLDYDTKAGVGRDHSSRADSMLDLYYIGELDTVASSSEITSSENIEADEHEDEYFVEIEGQAIKTLTIKEIADLWEIDAEEYLSALEDEFGLVGAYTVDSVLDDLREEYKFSPSLAKDVAEEVRAGEYVATSEVELSSDTPYNFSIPFFGSIFTYVGWYYITKSKFAKGRKYLSVHTFNLFWNTVMLLTLVIPSLGFGLFMIARYSFPRLYDIDLNFLYWHVELSIVMGTVSALHLIQRFKPYIAPLKLLRRPTR